MRPSHLHVVRYNGVKQHLHRMSEDELWRLIRIAHEHIARAKKLIDYASTELDRRTLQSLPFTDDDVS